jgi:hypothetical protein
MLPSGTEGDTVAIARVQARVDAAAFALLREGKNPTVSLVRARMGGGSPNVVAPALQRWRLTFAAQLDDNASSALEVLPPGVLELVQALWSRALFEAHRVRADARSTADVLEQLQAAIRALHDQAARLREREANLDVQQRQLDDRLQAMNDAKMASVRRSAPPRPVKAKTRPGKLKAPKSRRTGPAARRVRPAKVRSKRR